MNNDDTTDGIEQFERVESGSQIAVELKDTMDPDVGGSTVWRKGHGLSRRYRESITREFVKTEWYGNRASEVVIEVTKATFSVEIPDIKEWSIDTGEAQSGGDE